MLLTVILTLLVSLSLVLQRRLISDQRQQLLCDRPVLATSVESLGDKVLDQQKHVDDRRSEMEVATIENALSKLRIKMARDIRDKDDRIAALEQQLSQVAQGPKQSFDSQPLIIDRADDGIRPLRVTVAHYPRSDRLGSFVLSSIILLAVTHRWGWEMEVLPYDGSFGSKRLQMTFATLGKKAEYRKDYNPVDLNAQAYSNLGFFPEQPFPVADIDEWTKVKPLPAPGSTALHKACRKNPLYANGYVRCRLILPLEDATGPLLKHMLANGKLEDFFTPEFRQRMRDRFIKANAHRLTYFTSNSTDYNVAIHVRRGDVNKKEYPDRWTDQNVYATISRHICKSHPTANIHVFSEGDNEEGWKALEQVSDTCGSVSFHLYENEFDVWAHFVAADAVVTSRSTFSYVPALISGGEIYAPEWGHAPLEHWHAFNNENGELIRP